MTKPFKSPVSVNGEVPKVIVKENKPASKISIDDLPSEVVECFVIFFNSLFYFMKDL